MLKYHFRHLLCVTFILLASLVFVLAAAEMTRSLSNLIVSPVKYLSSPSWTNLSWYAWNFPTFSTESLSFWETPLFQAPQIGRSHNWTLRLEAPRHPVCFRYSWNLKMWGLKVLWGEFLSEGSGELTDQFFLLFFLGLIVLTCSLLTSQKMVP